ncbi:LuxR C-terminal-related transcriptional regulator [Mycobacterium sp. ITM-2016-00318]|uniref:LuxR C-terminal-related transcriptional regulator n=1 Tax=Mycobacterium sp. ITM-2016-00318 TaxID=2099693 RepID=UPI0037C7EE29
MSQLEWSEPADVRSKMASAVSGLPTGTVTLLLADVEGSTGLWETQPDAMTAAIARLDDTLTALVAAHHGVRPVEQGEGDSFVLAFARASDAVACALALQRAPLAPIRLRIGLNTGEIQLRDEGNYIGPTINRTARIRDLGHGGQTLLSSATESMVLDHLPHDAWLNDLGVHPLRDLPRPERVVALCHPDIRNDFPALRTPEPERARRLPVQLTSFIGRERQIAEVRELLSANRLVTLTGAGGSGKTRLAIHVAGDAPYDVGYVDLAPITDLDLVPVAVARALGLTDQPGRSTIDSLVHFIGDRSLLAVLDNCEHLLDASADLIVAVLEACPGLTVLATSREPIGLDGEVTWRVPSLSLTDEAVVLFTDRARRVRPDFTAVGDDAVTVTEICKRLDGMPLAIELAAARVRALSLTEILDSLHDRFRLLTGGARRAVRRQQSLGASVDWSHALLTEPERVLFRRLSVFMGGFDFAAAQEVCGGDGLPRHQILDQLSLLVDKSLVIAETERGRTRYRLLETIRQYAMEKLGESGEADEMRESHREYFESIAQRFDVPSPAAFELLFADAEAEIDNLRAAFAWSVEHGQSDRALQLACSMYPVWLLQGRPLEGLAWFDAIDVSGASDVSAAVRARSLADSAALGALTVDTRKFAKAEEALSIARELDDPALLARALTSCIAAAAFDVVKVLPYIAEALDVARELGDRWRLSQVLAWHSYTACLAGDPVATAAAGEEGEAYADAVGDRFIARMCRYWGRGIASFQRGELALAFEVLGELLAEADATDDAFYSLLTRIALAHGHMEIGETAESRRLAEEAVEYGSGLGPFVEMWALAPLARAALAQGDITAAVEVNDIVAQRMSEHPELGIANVMPTVELAVVRGDLHEARKLADQLVAPMMGWHRGKALTARAHVALALDDAQQAELDAYEALSCATEVKAYLIVPDALDILAELSTAEGRHREAARYGGAAAAIRKNMGGLVRYPLYEPKYTSLFANLRDALGNDDFDSAWSEGAALSLEEAIAYAQRGRGERKRPSTGWDSLTPTELDVVRLMSEGLGNKDIAARLFVSHRTVQTHLTHVYGKLGLTSRVALAQEAARHE